MNQSIPTTAPSTVRMLQTSLSIPLKGRVLVPADFQAQLIENITGALLRDCAPPCLLRAPTGAGKTIVIGQVLQRLASHRDVLWFWFVPFVTLVNQTLDSLLQNAPMLAPTPLSQGRNQDLGAGAVLISTAQGVARAQWRTKGYNADGDDDVRTLAALVARARAKGLQVGIVVDEAHIGLDKGTEFGQFANWLQADYLFMATATPKDQRLTDFLAHAGYGAHEHFSVSRDDVVKARLNKQYIEAVVYSLGGSMAQVTDLRRTLLRQAWGRNQHLGQLLRQHGVDCEPLLLVQVANGDNSVDEAAHDLQELCSVPPEAIGKHWSNDPDPGMMAAIANDTSKRVLIFKQSAGTGFDAPRAFVLASTKPVNDVDFAMQFIGRVMRVAREVREKFPRPLEIPAELNTAYVYLGNQQAQAGFEAAVQATSAIKSELEGQTEKLMLRRTMAGGVVYTNRPTSDKPLSYSFGIGAAAPQAADGAPSTTAEPPSAGTPGGGSPLVQGGPPLDGDLFGGTEWTLDNVAPESGLQPGVAKSPKETKIRTQADVLQALRENRLNAFVRKRDLPTLEDRLKTEEKPSVVDMSAISLQISQQLTISDALLKTAVRAALNINHGKEMHKELTDGSAYSVDVHVVTDRQALGREAREALQQLPHAEDEDYRIVTQTLSARLRPAVAKACLDFFPDNEDAQNDSNLDRMARDAAHWVIRDSAADLCEAIFEAVADNASLVDAQPLPDVMIFPQDMPLQSSQKNIYGVLPPSGEDAHNVEAVLFMDERRWWCDQSFELDCGSTFRVGRYDGAVKLNKLERDFAVALDESDFVLWWHRNPDKKPYAVRVVRADHSHYFYPDFLVCVEHATGEKPMQRLLETKQDTKDAARKARHFPAVFGRVLFLTPDGDRLRWVNSDGSLGEIVRLSEMESVAERLIQTRPA